MMHRVLPARRSVAWALAISCLLCAPAIAVAQTESATLSGRVLDPSGAVVANARVEATNVGTGVATTTESNDVGQFALTLRPGSYRVVVEKSGFLSTVSAEVELHVQQTLSRDFGLLAAGVAETVTVTGMPDPVRVTPSVGTVVTREFVENLPLNGRSFQSLLELTPGVVLARSDGNNGGQFSVNGQRTNANYFTVDGVSANAGASAQTSLVQYGAGSLPSLAASGGTNNLVSVDALQEFQVQTSAFAPEYGRTAGGQVSIVTRSGTNNLHGTAFDYFRDDALDAANFFVKLRGQSKPELSQHDFGGVLGGPILRNRTFFFASYEGLRLKQPLTTTVVVPSVVSRANAPAHLRPYLEAFPLPNGANLPNGFAELNASYSNDSHLDATSVRLDHYFSGDLSIFGRFNYSPSDAQTRRSSVNNTTASEFLTETLTSGGTWVLSGSAVNEVRFNWTKATGGSQTTMDDYGGARPLPRNLMFPSFAPDEGSFFAFSILGGGNSQLVGRNAANVQKQLNIVDTIAMVLGPHQLKFGVDYRRLTPNLSARLYGLQVDFQGIAGVNSGIASQVFIQGQSVVPELAFNNLSLFAQDAWRTTDRLTLTYGLRWDLNPPPTESTGHPPLALTGTDRPATFAVAPNGTPLWETRYTSFAPRVGLGYRLGVSPGTETTLRGGYGMFYDLGNDTAGNAVSGNGYPYGNSSSILNTPSFPSGIEQFGVPALSPNPPYPFLFGFDPHLSVPRTHQWNVAIERALGSRQTVTATYIGSIGRRLLRLEQYFQPSPSFSRFVNFTRSNASSDYKALQLQYQHRMSRGVQALVSYTLAESMDNVSNDTLGQQSSLVESLDRARGPSDFDVRHVFTGAVTYQFPQARSSTFLSALTGGWGVDAIVRARTGLPINVTSGTQPIQQVIDPRADVVSGQPFWVDNDAAPGGRVLNRAAFAFPAQSGVNGTLPRNAVRGFGMAQLDLSVRRSVSVGGGRQVQLRADVFNALNTALFGDPVANLSSGLFGQSTATLNNSLGNGGAFAGGFSQLYQIGGPRSMQLAVKFLF